MGLVRLSATKTLAEIARVDEIRTRIETVVGVEIEIVEMCRVVIGLVAIAEIAEIVEEMILVEEVQNEDEIAVRIEEGSVARTVEKIVALNDPDNPALEVPLLLVRWRSPSHGRE